MAAKGAAMQSCILDLVKGLEELHVKREELARHIEAAEEEQRTLEANLAGLQGRLQHVTASLAKKVTTRGEYDRVIRQTEEALQKIVESSQTLVAATKKSAADIARLAEQAG